MADHVDRKKRSLIMAAVHSRGSWPELAIGEIVRELGYPCELHVRELPGRPDLAFPALHKAIFVHGCFWHRHKKCRYSTSPKTRRKFWEAKFSTNVARDRRNMRQLKRMNWDVMTVWQCQLKPKNLKRLRTRLNDFLSK